MAFRKIKWPASEEKPKLGGVCHGDAVSPMYWSRPSQCQTRGAASAKESKSMLWIKILLAHDWQWMCLLARETHTMHPWKVQKHRSNWQFSEAWKLSANISIIFPPDAITLDRRRDRKCQLIPHGMNLHITGKTEILKHMILLHYRYVLKWLRSGVAEVIIYEVLTSSLHSIFI